MTAALEQHDWSAGLAQRTRTLGGGEITAILALAGATDVITFSGGFPDPATFPAEILAQIAGRLIAGDAAVALQYTATEGLAGVRDYVAGRLESLEGARPGPGELMITSGGIDCMELLAKSYVDPGDVVVVEAPTYLGGIMAFRGYEADVRGVPMDDDGMRVDVLASLLAGGLRPKIVYTIPDYQNPTGLSMSADRRTELVGLARRYGFLILEDVAYRELGFGRRPASATGQPLVARAGRGAAGGHRLEDLLPGGAAGLGGRTAAGHRQARGRQAELRPVLRRARPADVRGIRPGRAPGPADRRVAGALRSPGRADHAGAGRPHAGRHDMDNAARRVLRLADRPGRG